MAKKPKKNDNALYEHNTIMTCKMADLIDPATWLKLYVKIPDTPKKITPKKHQ